MSCSANGVMTEHPPGERRRRRHAQPDRCGDGFGRSVFARLSPTVQNPTARDYILRAGGFFGQNANKKQIEAIAAMEAPGGFSEQRPKAGDTITALPNFNNGAFELFKDLTTIIFQVATTALID